MTDVPPGSGAPGETPGAGLPPVRRSSFVPPPDDAEPPAFDDDALADALAAQVASYTSPIPVQKPAATPEERPADAEVPPTPAPDVAPVETPVDEVPEVATPVVTEEPSVSSTLEAIERLESELRRRAAEAGTPLPAAPEPLSENVAGADSDGASEEASSHTAEQASGSTSAPLFPAPPTYLRPAPPEEPPTLVEPPAFEPPAFTSSPFAPSPFARPEPQPPEPEPFTPEPLTPEPAEPPTGEPAALVEPVAVPDLAHLPPPVGLEPAPLPPYDPDADPSAPVGAAVDLPPPPGVAPLEQPGEDDDVVDDVDRAFGTGAIPVDPTGAAVLAPPSRPIPTVRIPDDEPALVDEKPQQHPALLVETTGPEPTALDLRAGRAARLFWVWFAANSSVVALALGAVILGLGMSLRQTLVAVLVGVALSFLPLGLGTLAGKWTGQPTMIVSRATFGVRGNVVPAAVAVVARVFWGGAFLWVLATGVARVLVDAGLDVGLGETVWTFVALGAGAALVVVVALFGYGLLARMQLVLSVVTALLVVGLIVITFPRLDIAAAQTIPDGPWILLVSGAVLVFSVVGLAWVHSTADVARYQRPGSDGGATMLWATFGATLPAFVLVAWGALLAASDPLIADGLATNPLHTIAALLPIWYPAPLLAAVALGLLSGAVLTLYSAGFAVQAVGAGLRRPLATGLASVLLVGVAVVLSLLVGDARVLLRDVATTLAVPVAAWAGLFATETMIRRRRFHAPSLLRPGGIYPAVRWVNLVGLVVITALGFGLTSAALPGLDWQGYLWPLLGLPSADPIVETDLGVLVALALGILLPLATAVPAIRRQEAASVD